ncbi:MAG: NADPH-dependent F420 reductase [Anaerolineaceae bacterium]
MADIRTEVKTIGVIGGTGKEGKGLAYRWAKAGYRVLIGSRNIEKAQAAVDEIRVRLAASAMVEARINADAVRESDLAVLTVPYAAQADTLTALKDLLQGKILIATTVPLVPPKVTRVQLPAAGSATLEAQQILGEGTPVVAAFQNISYEKLLTDQPMECDVLVCGTGKAARETALKLVEDAGLIGWDGGPLENSVVVEGMTSILIGLNKQHGVQSAGIKITGIQR